MPRLSAFTPCGVLRLSSQPSEAQQIYDALVASLGPPGSNYNVDPGSREDGWCYAMARCLAVVRLTLIHAGRQIDPSCVFEYLADREQEYGIIPGPDDTILQRRATLAARMVLPRGARREAVVAALSTLLGVDFVAYRTTKPAEIATWPASSSAQPINFQPPTVARKLYRVTSPITVGLGAPQTVTCAAFDKGESPLLVGDVLVVEPENPVRAEKVTVTAVSPASGQSTSFTATFNGPHNLNCLATTNPFPAWVSTQRQDLVIVDAAAALDLEARRKLNDLLERILRGVSQWSIVESTGTGLAGPFLIGVSPIGSTPLGEVSFP